MGSRLALTFRGLPRFGTGGGPGGGLGRMRRLIEPLAPWLSRQHAIKITGSNGKTSLAVMTEAVLRALGASAGLFISPHLHRFEERILTDGAPISERALTDAGDRVEARWRACRRGSRQDLEEMAAFEALTAAALYDWSSLPEDEAGPRALILEAGIGGRLDSTRVVPGEIAALTTVELEHTAVLGKTRETILLDKARLCPDGGILVSGPLDPGLAALLAEDCRRRKIEHLPVEAQARWRQRGFQEIPSSESGPQGDLRRIVDLEIKIRGDENRPPHLLKLAGLRLRLLGERQVQNAGAAVLLAWEWWRRHRPRPSLPRSTQDFKDFAGAVRRGLESARCPGRLERVHREPDVFVDVGHTPAAVAGALATLAEIRPEVRPVVILGVSPEKKVSQIAAAVAVALTLKPLVRSAGTSGGASRSGGSSQAGSVVSTRASAHGAPMEQVAVAVISADSSVRVVRAAAPAEALKVAQELAEVSAAPVLAVGSLYLAAEIREILGLAGGFLRHKRWQVRGGERRSEPGPQAGSEVPHQA